MALPHVDVSTSNYTINAAMLVASAKDCVDKAYYCEARGKHELADQMLEDAATSYEAARSGT